MDKELESLRKQMKNDHELFEKRQAEHLFEKRELELKIEKLKAKVKFWEGLVVVGYK